MTCSEKELQKVIEDAVKNAVEPLKEQNKALAEENKELQKVIEDAVKNAVEPLKEENKKLQQQIAELKANQTKAFKQMFEMENTIKEELAKLIEMQIDKYLKDLQTKQDATIENQHEIAEFLKLLQKELVNHIKESKESDKELLDKGDKILEVLDDMGKGLVEAHKSIMDSNENWGVAMLKRFDTLGIGITGLAKRIDNASEYVRENNDMTYKAVKELESTIHRKTW